MQVILADTDRPPTGTSGTYCSYCRRDRAAPSLTADRRIGEQGLLATLRGEDIPVLLGKRDLAGGERMQTDGAPVYPFHDRVDPAGSLCSGRMPRRTGRRCDIGTSRTTMTSFCTAARNSVFPSCRVPLQRLHFSGIIFMVASAPASDYEGRDVGRAMPGDEKPYPRRDDD